jgi:hypothetical protein
VEAGSRGRFNVSALEVTVESNRLDCWGQNGMVVMDPHDLCFEKRKGCLRSEMDVVFAQLGSDARRMAGEKKTGNMLYFESPTKMHLRKACS